MQNSSRFKLKFSPFKIIRERNLFVSFFKIEISANTVKWTAAGFFKKLSTLTFLGLQDLS
jgi:hypothetical protein